MEEKKLTDEKTLEFDDDVVDLLVEFDEMGFVPTTTCSDPDECARDWWERLVCAIKRVLEEKAEIATLKTELRKECEEHEEFTKKAKVEIERLTERLDYFQKSSDYHEGNQKELEAKNTELQKQVDELTDKLGKVLSGIKADELLVAKGVEQAVKDTAKEIYSEIDDSDILTVDTQDYGEIDVVPIERLKEIIKSKGVEVK